ncbi:RbsD/FucU domain-containing protein [Octadecabacter sp. 1_MG-2023]|uniref:RbsD/FucU family protein n=1 Tax=unclassified Octadecabacter TaxID=196158 RepID=UPI001C08DBAC|nr:MULTISPECIES: RbsD/FucU domain-containing protein [unclassified Octadecabacter]MBU2994568.1 ribose ABC transporter [Octadecabacter sp. B2R22]MDO6734139.1 RbsD/FucU domain-containing protein [Octadecabacter sp. 1_MG-2023]
MLRNIPPILSPEILWALRAMGHGDDVVIADANFPATALGARVHRLDGLTATDVLQAVLTVLPMDRFVDSPALVMEVVDDPDVVPPIVDEFQTIATTTADIPVTLDRLERFAFYDRAKTAFAVIQTGETRLYGNIILKKGVIGA